MNKVEMSGKSGLAAVLEFSCCSHGPIVISVLTREEPGIDRKTGCQLALPLTCLPQKWHGLGGGTSILGTPPCPGTG